MNGDPEAVSGESYAMKERRGAFEAVIAASLLIHASVVWMLPGTRAPHGTLPPSIIELVEPEVPPAPAPLPTPKAEPAPEPAPRRAPRVPPKIMPKSQASDARETEAVAQPALDPPADFTSTLAPNTDAPGIAIPIAVATAASAERAPRVQVAEGPRFVTAAELSKLPRAPALDRALEKNYPREARRSGISGRAVLRVRILPSGRLGDVRRISETYSGFGEACERTVRSGVWEPPLDRIGKRVATEITYTCRFEVGS